MIIFNGSRDDPEQHSGPLGTLLMGFRTQEITAWHIPRLHVFQLTPVTLTFYHDVLKHVVPSSVIGQCPQTVRAQ